MRDHENTQMRFHLKTHVLHSKTFWSMFLVFCEKLLCHVQGAAITFILFALSLLLLYCILFFLVSPKLTEIKKVESNQFTRHWSAQIRLTKNCILILEYIQYFNSKATCPLGQWGRAKVLIWIICHLSVLYFP